MRTEVVAVDPTEPNPAAIERAAAVLRNGGLVAFPTETVYGLGADATSPEAVARIFEAKGRPATNPTIVHIPNIDGARSCAAHWPKDADRLAMVFWPGPLTIVVPAGKQIAINALAGGSTVGLRAPNNPVALALLRAVRLPIAAPSANRSESLSPTTAEHVLRTLDGRIDLILDGGPTSGGVESTVIDMTVSPPRVLRPGLIGRERLRGILPDVVIGADEGSLGVAKSPGRMQRHYAPTTPMELAADVERRASQVEGRIAVVTFGAPSAPLSLNKTAVHRILPDDPAAAAKDLYSVLHELDRSGASLILFQTPPEGDDWSAIRDRLQRAATRA
jgi:L-threonylcarbamoyladenylate synthase